MVGKAIDSGTPAIVWLKESIVEDVSHEKAAKPADDEDEEEDQVSNNLVASQSIVMSQGAFAKAGSLIDVADVQKIVNSPSQ